MNSILKGLLSWALSAAKSEGQTVGLKALHDATTQLNQVLITHAPDLAPALQPVLQQVVQGAVAGILSKVGN